MNWQVTEAHFKTAFCSSHMIVTIGGKWNFKCFGYSIDKQHLSRDNLLITQEDL